MENREREKKWSQDYRKNNKESVKAYHRQYREANKESVKAYQRQYREANRKKIAKKAQRYRQANKEKLALAAAQWYKRYRAANGEKIAKATNKMRGEGSSPDSMRVTTPAATGGTADWARRLQEEGRRCVKPWGEEPRRRQPTHDTGGQNAARLGASKAAGPQVAKCQEDQVEEVNDGEENAFGDEQARMRRQARPWKSTADAEAGVGGRSKADSSAGTATGNGFVNGHRPRIASASVAGGAAAKVVEQEDEEEEERQADLWFAWDGRIRECRAVLATQPWTLAVRVVCGCEAR